MLLNFSSSPILNLEKPLKKLKRREEPCQMILVSKLLFHLTIYKSQTSPGRKRITAEREKILHRYFFRAPISSFLSTFYTMITKIHKNNNNNNHNNWTSFSKPPSLPSLIQT